MHRLIELGGTHVRAQAVRRIEAAGQPFDVIAVSLGNPEPTAPTLGLFGGVHGLERIGTEVVLSFLSALVHRLKWDDSLHAQLDTMRLVFMPVVNPGGLWLGTRANPHGVDLMRNAPVEATEPVPLLVGGQRLSAALPWFRGPAGQPMQPEAQALCEVVQAQLLGSEFALALDCHSGFGVQDRLWFPYAHTSQPPPNLAELHALHRLLDQSHPHHHYIFEPQSAQYLTHGDLWDHLYRLSLPDTTGSPGGGSCFLPLTLEMGSWLWVKKNPRQLFNRHGIFNPLIEHRHRRVLRRHLPLLEFLMRAAASHARWMPPETDRPLHHRQGLARWYPEQPRQRGLVRP
ncbi:MAG: hypothetical protein RI907_3945 [Pseudomonadota bacterium]